MRSLGDNSLAGGMPQALESKPRMGWFQCGAKDLPGTIPAALTWIGRREKTPSLSGLVAGDSAICGRLAALILRLRPAGLRFEEFRSPVKRGGLGLRFSNRSGLRPAAGWGRLRFESAAVSQNFVPTRELVAISVRVEVAGDVATQIASDLRPRVEGH